MDKKSFKTEQSDEDRREMEEMKKVVIEWDEVDVIL